MLAMMLVASAITATELFWAQRNETTSVERGLLREFQGELAALHGVQELRQAALADLGRVLVRKPRIHAALEDDARDLLYPIARDELRDLMNPGGQPAARRALQGAFYRFLDQKGILIPPPARSDAGELRPAEEALLSLPGLPREQQVGYLMRHDGADRDAPVEVVAMPIISTETDEAIGALAIGFKPVEPGGLAATNGLRSGLWLNGRLVFPSLSGLAREELAGEVARAMADPGHAGSGITVMLAGVPHLVFHGRLNPGSLFPPAFEVSIYPLTDLLNRQRQLRRRILGAGALLLLGGFVASHLFSRGLSAPVERLAVDSEENRVRRARRGGTRADKRGPATRRPLLRRRVAPAQDPGDRAPRRSRGTARARAAGAGGA